MLRSLGHEVSSVGVARLYAGLCDVFVLDAADATLAPVVEALGMRAVVADTIMTDDAARNRLARDVLAAAGAA
jgi:LPPG:FO 2-phospho-L-lactate transferase